MRLKDNELHQLARQIIQTLPKGGIILLVGDLAAGKTTLVKSFAVYQGIEDAVTSPTFSLQQCYGKELFHYDIYNHGLDHFLALGLLEELERSGYHFIEWGDDALLKLLRHAGLDVMRITIEKCADDARCYEVEHA
jgi:tRNA threonylcarbamoyladenosine biosynthesis protein TsaE